MQVKIRAAHGKSLKRRSQSDQNHLSLFSDFRMAVDVLLRFRAWYSVPADLRDEWRDLQIGILEAKGLLLVARAWPEPGQNEAAKAWATLSTLHCLWGSDAKLVLFAAAGISLKAIGKARGQSLPQAIADLERSLGEVASSIAAGQAA
jgi:hypothetical protein